MRNEIYLYAIDSGKDIPIGVLDAGVLDADRIDEDADAMQAEQEDLLDGVVEELDEEAMLRLTQPSGTSVIDCYPKWATRWIWLYLIDSKAIQRWQL